MKQSQNNIITQMVRQCSEACDIFPYASKLRTLSRGIDETKMQWYWLTSHQIEEQREERCVFQVY